jgi:hypothetical protein
MDFVTRSTGKSKFAATEIDDLTLQPNVVDGSGTPFVAIRIPTGAGLVFLDGSNTAILTLTPTVDGLGNPIYEQS